MDAERNNGEVLGHFYQIQIELTAGPGVTVTTTPSQPIGSVPFVWEELGGAWDASNGDWDIRITDDGMNRPFSPHRIKVSTLLGSTEREPYKLRTPWTFPAGGGILIEAQNRHATGTDTLTLTFIGRRLQP